MPFFVKAPGQTEGEVDDSIVRNIDVVPTIADLLDIQVFWQQRRLLGLLRGERRRATRWR